MELPIRALPSLQRLMSLAQCVATTHAVEPPLLTENDDDCQIVIEAYHEAGHAVVGEALGYSGKRMLPLTLIVWPLIIRLLAT